MEYKPLTLNARLILGGCVYYRNATVRLPIGDHDDYLAMGFGREPTPLELAGKIHRPFRNDIPRVEQGPKPDFEPATEEKFEDVKPEEDNRSEKQRRRDAKNALRHVVVTK